MTAREFPKIARGRLTTLQINVGKRCNQACHHCHVEAGPKRTEMMERKTVDRLVELLAHAPEIATVDITGGAPELNPNFRELVVAARRLGREVIDRCNLTVLFEPGQESTAEFLATNRVQITASLPCYTLENVDEQRGHGVFDKSIRALRLLNELGYGRAGTGLGLNLVYNPLGAYLPGPQGELEADYKRELKAHFGIEFSSLFTLTNMPIKRFLRQLERDGELEAYMELLVSSFNPAALENVMCRTLVSVGWDGQLYDCDFNQMLELPLGAHRHTIWDISSLGELTGAIAVDRHCFGCTAGAGSSCGGSLV